MTSVKTRMKKMAEATKFLLAHPYESMVAVHHCRYEHEMLVKEKSGYAPLREIELKNILGGDIPRVLSSYLGGGSTALDYALLKGVCEQCANEYGEGADVDYLEIGTWRGESIINVMNLDCVRSAYSITLDESKYTDERTKRSINFFINAQRDKYKDKFRQIFADSMSFDFDSLGKKFDVIFIDGDHSYDAILSDSRNALKLLKNKNSVIVWQDYTNNAESGASEIRMDTLAALREAIPAEEQQYLYRVRNTLCAIYMRKKMETTGDLTPTFLFEAEIKARPIL